MGRSAMTFLEAAVAVLEAADNPLTAEEITKRASAGRLLGGKGKTPVATMRSVLYRSVKRQGSPVVLSSELAVKRAKWGSVKFAIANRPAVQPNAKA